LVFIIVSFTADEALSALVGQGRLYDYFEMAADVWRCEDFASMDLSSRLVSLVLDRAETLGCAEAGVIFRDVFADLLPLIDEMSRSAL
jgi:hypothetical protein